MIKADISGYTYRKAELNHSHGYLLAAVTNILDGLNSAEKRVFEVACGNGSVASELAKRGWTIISPPHHSYVKNLAMAATGKMDAHFTALWDHDHIKF